MKVEIEGVTYEDQGTGTFFRVETDGKLRGLIDAARVQQVRMRVTYGNRETGSTVLQKTGFIGRSDGKMKMPLIVGSYRHDKGYPLLDHMIVKMEPAVKKIREQRQDWTWVDEKFFVEASLRAEKIKLEFEEQLLQAALKET